MATLFFKGKLVKIDKYDSETEPQWKERLRFIVPNLAEPDIIKYSFIHVDNIFFGVRYTKEKEERLRQLRNVVLVTQTDKKFNALYQTSLRPQLETLIEHFYTLPFKKIPNLNNDEQLLTYLEPYRREVPVELNRDIGRVVYAIPKQVPYLFEGNERYIKVTIDYLKTEPTVAQQYRLICAIFYLQRHGDQVAIVQQLKARLQPGGYLVLAENSINIPYDAYLLDLYKTIEGKSGYEGHYRNREDWHQLLQSLGFKLIATTKPGEQGIFWSVFTL